MTLLRALRVVLVALALHLIGAAGAAGSVALGPVQSEIETPSGSTITVGVRIGNAGDSAVTLSLRPELPPGWSVLIPPGELSLGAGDSRVALVTVNVPNDASAGTYPLAVGVLDAGGEAVGHVEFSIVIPLTERVDLVRAEGPEYATGPAFTTAFLVRNEGNGPATWALAARSSAGLELEVTPARLSLEPGETARIDVEATVPADLTASTRHVIVLSAQRGESTESLAEARSTTMLIPVDPQDRSAMHTYPLTASFGFGVRVDDGISASLPEVALSGSGKLPGRDGILAIDLAGSPLDPVGTTELLVSYRAGWGTVAVGHQPFTRSTLVGTERGFGVAFDTSWSEAALKILTDAHVYLSDTSGARSASAGLTVSFPAGIYVGARGHAGGDGSIGTLSAGYRAPTANPAPVSLSHLGVTYGVRPASSGWRAGHAVHFRASAQGGPVGLLASYRIDTAAFSRSDAHGSELSLQANLRVPADFALAGVPEIRLQAQYTESRAWSAFDGLPSTAPSSGAERAPETTDSIEWTFGVTLAATVYDVALELGHLETFEQEIGASRHTSVTHVQATAPLTEQIELQQKLAWVRANDMGEQMVRSEGSLVWSDTGAGDFTAGYVLDLDLSIPARHEVTLSGGWSGEVGPTLSLGAGLAVGLRGHHRWADIDLDTTLRLPNGHALQLEGSGEIRSQHHPSATVAVTYTLPFQVTLGPRGHVGIIQGTVRTHEGVPLAGAVVSAGGGLGVTGADGEYVVQGVPAGSHVVRLLTDTLTLADPVVDPQTPPEVEVVAGEVVEMDFTVSPGATLSGRILPDLGEGSNAGEAVGPDTDPESVIHGAWVEVTAGDVVLRGVTDARGSFRFPGLPAGTWTVRVTRPGLPDDWRLEGSELTFELAPGQEREMIVDLVAVQRTIRFQEGGSVGGGDREP